MSLHLVEDVSVAQRGLCQALDAGTAEEVGRASARLAQAVAAVRAAGAWRPTPELKALLARALADGEAARLRTRALADHGRRRLDRLHALTGRGVQRYGRTGRYL